MQSLYPAIRTYNKHSINVDDIHCLYVEESGDPEGIPVLFIHGGPGIGCSKDDRRFFDPEKYRIILFDQRGAGQSKPHANLNDNTTEHLVHDIEQIRQHLNIEQWVLFGGSWGATLALVYAQAHPQRVLAMILRGIFLCRPKDLKWIYQCGADRVFPDYWSDFIAHLSDNEHQDIIAAYYKRLTGANELAKMAAAKAWALWEARCSTLRPNTDITEALTDPHTAVSLSRIEAHYFMNKAFLDANQILDNMEQIKLIPSTIIHGRYDMICPLDNAYELHQKWDNAELHIVRDAGHSSHEPSITDALIKATDGMAQKLSKDGGNLG